MKNKNGIEQIDHLEAFACLLSFFSVSGSFILLFNRKTKHNYHQYTNHELPSGLFSHPMSNRSRDAYFWIEKRLSDMSRHPKKNEQHTRRESQRLVAIHSNGFTFRLWRRSCFKRRTQARGSFPTCFITVVSWFPLVLWPLSCQSSLFDAITTSWVFVLTVCLLRGLVEWRWNVFFIPFFTIHVRFSFSHVYQWLRNPMKENSGPIRRMWTFWKCYGEYIYRIVELSCTFGLSPLNISFRFNHCWHPLGVHLYLPQMESSLKTMICSRVNIFKDSKTNNDSHQFCRVFTQSVGKLLSIINSTFVGVTLTILRPRERRGSIGWSRWMKDSPNITENVFCQWATIKFDHLNFPCANGVQWWKVARKKTGFLSTVHCRLATGAVCNDFEKEQIHLTERGILQHGGKSFEVSVNSKTSQRRKIQTGTYSHSKRRWVDKKKSVSVLDLSEHKRVEIDPLKR